MSKKVKIKNNRVKKSKISMKKFKPTPNFSKKKIFSKVFVAIVILLIGIVGYRLLAPSSAAPTSDCGSTTVQDYTYQVPFGNAVWNQKVCNLPKYPKSQEYASRLLNWSYINKIDSPESPSNPYRYITNNFGFGPNFATTESEIKSSWSRNVYYASDATTTTKLRSNTYTSNLDGIKWNSTPQIAIPGYSSNNPDTRIPWNPKWVTGRAGDNEIIILDESNGRIYELWGYWATDLERVQHCFGIPGDRICTQSANVGRDVNGSIIDYRTFEGAHGDRGVGLSKMITFTMPEELLAGEIRHALGVAIPNVAMGPICTNQQLGTSAEGNTCGTAVAPATKVEQGINTSPTFIIDKNRFPQTFAQYTQDKMIPEGMRFALDISNSQIDAWIQSRQDLRTNPRLAQTAKIIAVALRDYGIIIADTSGYGPGIQVAGTENPDTRAKWEQLGLNKDNVNDLLDDLINNENLYVVDPPTLTCKDGSKTKYYCDWTKAEYTQTTNPDPEPDPTLVYDFNNNKKVDVIDFSILFSSYNKNVAKHTSGDCNGDSRVTQADFILLLTKYGQTVP